MTIPAIRTQDIIHQADLFLQKYNPLYDCPIPIENIVETKLKINIFPIKDLEKKMGIDGSISKDFKTIEVDEYVYMSQEERARFTIAHEIGHYILHRKLFEAEIAINSEGSFIDFQNKLSISDWGTIEKQAFIFAQELLMPGDIFRQEMDEKIRQLGGIDKIIISDLSLLISKVREIFCVSQYVALQKLKHVYPQIDEIAKFRT